MVIKRRDNKIVPLYIEDKNLPDSGYYIEDIDNKTKKELKEVKNIL